MVTARNNVKKEMITRPWLEGWGIAWGTAMLFIPKKTQKTYNALVEY
jgi:hypothetical protein